MDFVIVNGRKPRGLPRFCAFCCDKIEDSYTRDLKLGIVYCKVACFKLHVFQTQVAAGTLDGSPRLLTYEKGGLR